MAWTSSHLWTGDHPGTTGCERICLVQRHRTRADPRGTAATRLCKAGTRATAVEMASLSYAGNPLMTAVVSSETLCGLPASLMYVILDVDQVLTGTAMSVVTAEIRPTKLREAREILGLTQAQAARALGGVRPETVNRWERARVRKFRMKELHAQTIRYLQEAAGLLVELFPDPEARGRFLRAPHRELGRRSPMQVMVEDPPYGLRDVWRLLMRAAHGVPA